MLTTPPDVDAASVLKAALVESLHWRIDAEGVAASLRNRSWKSAEFVTSLYSDVEQASLRLHIPHCLEFHSSPEAPMSARPRLERGSLTFEASCLSIRMARALANAAESAASARDDPDTRTGGGPLTALDRLLAPMLAEAEAAGASAGLAAAARPSAEDEDDANPAPPQQQQPPNLPKPPPFFNEAALRASAANAATFPEISAGPAPGAKPANRPSTSSEGVGSGAARALDKSVVPADQTEAISLITDLGARVFEPVGGAIRADGWSALAGGDVVRRAVDEALLMPLARPEAFAAVLRATRASEVPPAARPTALLFHGPPGTGKTAAARIAAEMARLPLVAAPLESLISKWYGEGEQRLAALFARCEQLGPCVLFLDELDALAGSRDREMHEASRRMLSVLLRHLDGFDAIQHVALIGATNRPADLDAALVSRFDVRVSFPPPDAASRALVFARYAKHLPHAELSTLAEGAVGLSGRDILDACKQAERKWVYELLYEEVEAAGGLRVEEVEERQGGGGGDEPLPPPPLRLYVESVAERCEAVRSDEGEALSSGSDE